MLGDISASLEENFARAVEEENFRQSFLDIIASNGLPEYVAELVYYSVQKSNEETGPLMSTRPNPLARWYIKGTKSSIEVFPASFASDSPYFRHEKLDDFLSTLEDHEYFHAREFYKTPEIITNTLFLRMELLIKSLLNGNSVDELADSIDMFDLNIEIRACDIQTTEFPNRNCSKKYKTFHMLKRLDYTWRERSMKNFIKTTPITSNYD